MFPPWVAGCASICIRPWARFFLALIGLSKGAWCAPALITLSFLGRQCYAKFISNILEKTPLQMSQFYSDVPLSIVFSFFVFFPRITCFVLGVFFLFFSLNLNVFLQLQWSIDWSVMKSYITFTPIIPCCGVFFFKIMPIASSKIKTTLSSKSSQL